MLGIGQYGEHCMISYLSRTVTFLFTDIKGSTKLDQQYLDRCKSLCSGHRSILQSTIETPKGFIFQMFSNAFCADVSLPSPFPIPCQTRSL